jgi:hypothetical protein
MLNVDRFDDNQPVLFFGPRMACTCCGSLTEGRWC